MGSTKSQSKNASRTRYKSDIFPQITGSLHTCAVRLDSRISWALGLKHRPLNKAQQHTRCATTWSALCDSTICANQQLMQWSCGTRHVASWYKRMQWPVDKLRATRFRNIVMETLVQFYALVGFYWAVILWLTGVLPVFTGTKIRYTQIINTEQLGYVLKIIPTWNKNMKQHSGMLSIGSTETNMVVIDTHVRVHSSHASLRAKTLEFPGEFQLSSDSKAE